MNNNLWTAVLAGLFATVVLSLPMMLIVMPLAGAGLFGLRLGLMDAVMTLVPHVISGAMLGAGYGRFVVRG